MSKHCAIQRAQYSQRTIPYEAFEREREALCRGQIQTNGPVDGREYVVARRWDGKEFGPDGFVINVTLTAGPSVVLLQLL